MLTIECCDVVEELAIGDLFDQLGFSNDSPATDEDGDSYIKNDWAIEANSLDTYYPIEGFRWTKPEAFVELSLEDGQSLLCSPEHVVLGQNPSAWVLVRDLKPGDQVVTLSGVKKVKSTSSMVGVERLCDMQVSIAHSYYTNDILSHNSHFLVSLGASAMKAGIDVVHYTLELNEGAVGRRYDSHLCDIDSNDVFDNKEAILEKYRSMKLGRLIVKEFPTNTASIYTIRSHIERLDLKGFRPGLMLIDYADIMRSTRQYDSLRHELKLIYEELRGFAGERQFPIWTASQSNKEGSQNEIVDLGNMSESYGKAAVADVVLSLSRRAHEKSGGYGRLFVAKNRAGRDGIVFPVRIDTAKSKFEISGAAASPEETHREDADGFKKALKDKWRELKEDKLLSKQEPEAEVKEPQDKLLTRSMNSKIVLSTLETVVNAKLCIRRRKECVVGILRRGRLGGRCFCWEVRAAGP